MRIRPRRASCLRPAIFALLPILVAFLCPGLSRGKDKDIDPNFFAINDCPGEPGCPALVLLEETELSNEKLQARLTQRKLIKVFNEVGIMKYSDVQVAAIVGFDDIRDLAGRTILPNHETIPLRQEDIFVKTTYKRGKTRVRTKNAKFPGVVPGAIIEYSYNLVSPEAASYHRWTWEVQDELPVLGARFILKPGGVQFSWIQTGIDPAVLVHTTPFKTIQNFTMANVASVSEEPFGPPDNVRRTRVHFYEQDQATTWISGVAWGVSLRTGEFLSKLEGIPAKVKEITNGETAPEARLGKIYDFVQRQIGSEDKRLGQTEKSKIKDAENAGEVLARGYGNEFDRTMLFLAMVQEAGLPMGVLVIAGRNNAILNPDAPDPSQFDSFAATVKIGDNWTFYDPAAPHCPLGMISAEKEGVVLNALIVNPSKPSAPRVLGGVKLWDEAYRSYLKARTAPVRLVKVPHSGAAKNVLLRRADVRLHEDGSMEIDGTDQASGQVDMDQREDYGDLDEEKRKAKYSEEIHQAMPRAIVQSVAFEDFESFESPATLRFSLTLPQAVMTAGNRLVLTPSLFDAGRPAIFTSDKRRTPVSLPHTQKSMETLSFEIPSGWVVDRVPDRINFHDGELVLMTECKEVNGRLVFSRRVEVDPPYWPLDQYARLKAFFDKVQQADQQVAILRKGAPS
jgi:hypothetical protein